MGTGFRLDTAYCKVNGRKLPRGECGKGRKQKLEVQIANFG